MYMCGEIGKNKLLYSASFPLVFGVLGDVGSNSEDGNITCQPSECNQQKQEIQRDNYGKSPFLMGKSTINHHFQ